MKFYKMQCPSCGANLEVENELDSFFCKYCGTKIFIADQDHYLINAKARIKELNIKAQSEKLKQENELEIKKQDDKTFIIVMAIVLFFMIILIGLIIIKAKI